MARIDENILRTQFGFNDPNVISNILSDPGQTARYERELEGILRPRPSTAQPLQPGQRQAFQQGLRGEETEFLGRFRTEFPQILTGLEEQLGLPGLRESAFGLTKTLRNIPRVQEQAARGFDVTANQLARIISAEQQRQAPLAQEAVFQAQFAEEEFGRQADIALRPFETEISFMSDRFAREATGFSEDADRRLNLLLQQIQTEGATNIATIQQATQLAQLEESKRQFEQGISTIDLGNRIALIDMSGKEIGSFDKSKLGGGAGVGQGFGGTLESDIDAELQTLAPVPSAELQTLPPEPSAGRRGGFGPTTRAFG